MTCNQTRIAISALIDGEEPGTSADQVRAHVAGCPACQAWQRSAEEVTRTMRVQSVAVPDLTAQVLAAVAADPAASAGNAAAARAAAVHSRRQVLRLALAVSALAQLLLGLPLLFGGSGETLHVSREMASFDVAIAVGYLFAAWKPARASALVPVAVALSVCLLFTSTLDVANNGVLVAHEVGHLLAVLQAGLLWALGRASSPTKPVRTSGGSIRTAA
jgi:predicted anti-sigma-YlaC factor YlaD